MDWDDLRRMLVVLGLGMFGLGTAVGGFGTYVNELIAQGVSPGTAGLGSTLFLFGQLAIVLPADVLSRRHSIRHVTAAGLALGAIGIALGGSTAIELHLLGRLLFGIGNGVVFLLVIKYAGFRAPDGTVARVQGVLGALFTLGISVGIALTPIAVATLGPAVPSLFVSVPVAIAAPLTLSLRSVSSEGVVAPSAYLQPFASAPGITLGLANAASFGLLIVAITWYTEIVTREPLLPATAVLTSFAIATFVGRTGSGWLGTIATDRRAVGASLLFLAGTLGVVALGLSTGSVPVLAVGLVLTGLGFGLPFGPLFSLAFESVRADAGVLLVGMTALGNAAALAYPWLVGRLLEATGGYVVGFVVMAISVLLVAILWQQYVDGNHDVDGDHDSRTAEIDRS